MQYQWHGSCGSYNHGKRSVAFSARDYLVDQRRFAGRDAISPMRLI